jgi:Tfp pilus assembly protein PilE
MKNKKGISLIVLVITIIVIIILAGSVILSLSKNNPILSAQEATFKNDMDSLQSELTMYITKQYAQTLGSYDVNNMNGEVSTYIPSVTKYDSTFDVVKGKLIYTGTNTQNLSYARNMNLDISTVYTGTAEIVKPTLSVVNKTEGTVESWVNVTSVMRQDVAEKYIFSTYADEKYTNTLALRHTRDNTWQAIMSSTYNLVSDISVADTLNEGWHLFSIKWSATEFSLFIDGTKVATTAAPKLMTAVATNLYIGSGPKLNLVKNGYVSMGDNTNFPAFAYATSDYSSASSSLSAVGYINSQSTDYIKVDPNKSYDQIGSFKSVGAGGNSRVYYGIATYDTDYNYIDDSMTNHYLNTETELSQDLKPGDTIVYVKNASNWKKTADWDGNKYLAIYPYKDYPIYTYTRRYYQFTDSNATNNTITLPSPYGGTLIPAGTKIANNFSSYGTYTYSTVCGDTIPNIWTTYTSIITGNSINTSTWQQFRYGTKYIKVLFLLNYSQSSSYAMLFDDVVYRDSLASLYNSKIQELCISNIARSDSDILNRYKTGILVKDSNVTYMLTD